MTRTRSKQLLLYTITLTALSVFGYAMGAFSCFIGGCTQ